MSWYVYILRTNRNTLYTGITNNVHRRLEAHKKKKGAKYLRIFESFELVYTEMVELKGTALRREREIKKLSKTQKEAMIASFGQTRQVLFDV